MKRSTSTRSFRRAGFRSSQGCSSAARSSSKSSSAPSSSIEKEKAGGGDGGGLGISGVEILAMGISSRKSREENAFGIAEGVGAIGGAAGGVDPWGQPTENRG